ncbi:unnamed protein product [Ambrosiozyma monospora]|uniref:tRNA:m(4)X modification enzyme TRM13 n=1 Tax=Ambrosiozyma monospora TaxID=43982 RepID=A0A9W6Z3S1_AMBMO|nr:unnamed protein product [Ambrosiozyma monospora]
MFSWATNGIRPGLSAEDGADHFTGLDFKHREKIGLSTRRILDESRKIAMAQRGFEVELVKYVQSDISLENNCLLIKNI